MEAEVARRAGGGRVGRVDVADVRDEDVGGEGLVLEVVHEGQHVGRDGGGSGGVGRGPVDCAVESGGGGDLVGRLEDVGKLREEVGVVRVGGDGGYKGDEASVCVDHGLEGGPARGRGGGGGLVAVFRDARGLKDLAKGGGGLVVRVDEENSDDVVGVLVHPVLDGGEPVLEGAGVEEAAGGVTELEDAARGAVDEVDLGLKQAQARVEGDGGVVVLVAGDGV